MIEDSELRGRESHTRALAEALRGELGYLFDVDLSDEDERRKFSRNWKMREMMADVAADVGRAMLPKVAWIIVIALAFFFGGDKILERLH